MQFLTQCTRRSAFRGEKKWRNLFNYELRQLGNQYTSREHWGRNIVYLHGQLKYNSISSFLSEVFLDLVLSRQSVVCHSVWRRSRKVTQVSKTKKTMLLKDRLAIKVGTWSTRWRTQKYFLRAMRSNPILLGFQKVSIEQTFCMPLCRSLSSKLWIKL